MDNILLSWKMRDYKRIIGSLFIFYLLFVGNTLKAQDPDSSGIPPKRLKNLIIGSAAGYAAGWVGLYSLWYANQPRAGFNFFNDNPQWMLMDKAGHSYSTYHISRGCSASLQWAGLSKAKSSIYGSLSGFLLMLPIEIMDGHTAEYGASWGDLGANAFGSFLFAGQQLLWKESRIKPKFSYSPTRFAQLRPHILGKTTPSRIIKDYNGQTYWFSADFHKFLPKGNKFPIWLNVALGYGAEKMVYGHPEDNRLAGYTAYPQFFIGPDLDLSEIKTNKKMVKILFFILEGIRLPLPALELNKNSIRLHPVYF